MPSCERDPLLPDDVRATAVPLDFFALVLRAFVLLVPVAFLAIMFS